MGIDKNGYNEAVDIFNSIRAGRRSIEGLYIAQDALDRYLQQYDDNDTIKDPAAMSLREEIERRLEASVTKSYPRD